MFPVSHKEGETYIQRNSLDQLVTDELIDTVAELKTEIETLRRELKAFVSKQTTWEDFKLIDQNLQRREMECKIREEGLQTLDLHFLRQQEILRGIIQGEMYLLKREKNSEEPPEQSKPIIQSRRKRGTSPNPNTNP